MDTLGSLLRDVKLYIEESEVTMESEWGCNRDLREMLKDRALPEIYYRVAVALDELGLESPTQTTS